MDDLSQTQALLVRWHDGDTDALGELLERDLEWIQNKVRTRIGPLLSKKAEVDDYVNDALVQALNYGPRFVISDKTHFRALMARIVENMLRHHVASLKRQKRDTDRETPLARDTILYLDPPQQDVTRPSTAAERVQERNWIRLAVDLLPPEDGQIVRMHEWEGLPFDEIGNTIGMQKDAVRMRFRRSLPRLARLVKQLRSGEIQEAIDESLRDDL